MQASAIAEKITAVSDLIRLRKQYGTALLALPAMWSLVIASAGRPSVEHVLIFLVGSFLMRSAGCAINDVADRNIDKHVERTKTRPVADGRLGVKESLAVFAVLSLIALFLVLRLNFFTVKLAAAGLTLAIVYPFVKRISFFPQVVLGVAFGWGAVMAWAAVHEEIAIAALLIFIANIFYSTAYDTIYALMDMEDDKKAGVKSTAIFFGSRVWAALYVFYFLMAACLVGAGILAGLGVVYYLGVIMTTAALCFIVYGIRKNPEPKRAFNGFIANAWAGGFILFAIIIDFHVSL
ncbi:MAG: 4-hydroxybenzoate octaprenyltransferase [Deltaproteobacteria bacterium]|nr:4-hydroxybenzoate octaprenyltransferase [Deltaproteobacteria bacterium]